MMAGAKESKRVNVHIVDMLLPDLFVLLLQQPQPQPQPHLHQEVEFEHGRRHLAIVLDKERRALLVRRRPAPDTLVGLVLDPNLEQHTEQLLRERLVWRLSRVSLDGVPMPAALPPAAYYLYSPEQEQKLFGHCMQRVGAMLNLPPDALAGPGRRGRKRVSDGLPCLQDTNKCARLMVSRRNPCAEPACCCLCVCVDVFRWIAMRQVRLGRLLLTAPRGPRGLRVSCWQR